MNTLFAMSDFIAGATVMAAGVIIGSIAAAFGRTDLNDNKKEK